MNGGYWEYMGPKVRDQLEVVARDPEARERWPLLSVLFLGLGEWIAQTEREMDWSLSGDTEAEGGDYVFERKQILILFSLLVRITASDSLMRGMGEGESDTPDW